MFKGPAKVYINETVKLVTKGQSVYVTFGSVHLLMDPFKAKMFSIEVKTGGYLDEDDIVRY